MADVFGRKTIGDRLVETNNRPSGFDYLRIAFALSVIGWHSFEVCYGIAFNVGAWASSWRFIITFILPGFFCLSGFLVAGSMLRVKDLTVFMSLRGMRIFPALMVEVFLSAFLIGPLVTLIPLSHYFSSRMFFTYFLNITGDIHYYLPGVFTTNPAHTVNAQLWTIPYELECYIAIAIVWLAGLLTRRNVYLIALVGLVGILHIWLVHKGYLPHRFDLSPGRSLVIAFLVGIAFFLYKDRVPLNLALLAISVFVYFVFLLRPETAYLVPFPVGYITVYLGLMNPPRNAILDGGDYSYGLYLYGYPIQQVVSQLLPQYRFWYINLALTIVFAGAVAWCSWTFIEAKVLGRKKQISGYLKAIVEHIGSAVTRLRKSLIQSMLAPGADDT